MASVTLGIRSLAVVGESHYQRNIKRANRMLGGILAELTPEPHNRFDPNAVRVDLWFQGAPLHVGYIDRDTARRYQPTIVQAHQAGDRVILYARIFGGTREQPTLGVWIGENYA